MLFTIYKNHRGLLIYTRRDWKQHRPETVGYIARVLSPETKIVLHETEKKRTEKDAVRSAEYWVNEVARHIQK